MGINVLWTLAFKRMLVVGAVAGDGVQAAPDAEMDSEGMLIDGF